MSWVSAEPAGQELLPASKDRWGLMGNCIRVGLGQDQEEAMGGCPGLPAAQAQPPRACTQLSSHVPTEAADYVP